MSTEHSAAAKALYDRIGAGGFAIALSGGGHRATLATLGALMAIVDRRLGPKIVQIASVSGGSITNAFVAQRCRLEELGPGQLDEIAGELTSLIVQKGVLTRNWIAGLVLAPVALGAVTGSILRLSVLTTCLAVWVGIVVFCLALITAFIGNGLLVEWLINRRYFQYSSSNQSRVTHAQLASLSGRSIDHVFCMTDLVLGLPLYASSQHGGMIWRRLRPEPRGHISFAAQEFQTFNAGRVSIASIVRASAAFPGIAPRRMRLPPDPAIDLVAELPRVAFLSDGGLWNNLGSHVLREDGFIGTYATWENGVLRPFDLRGAASEMPLLCINGSAPLRPTESWVFQIPGVALIKSLLQVTTILNANTVLPRVQNIRRAFDRRTWSGRRPDSYDPPDVIVDLRPYEEIARDYYGGIWSEELIRKSDRSVKEWEESRLIDVRLALKSPDADWLGAILRTQPEPRGSFPVPGLANMEDWDALRSFPAWKRLVEEEASSSIDAPTTLDRIEPGLARRLIARGYLNAYLVSLFLAPLVDGELDRLAQLPDRLDKIVAS